MGKPDLTGMTFGSLYVSKRSPKSGTGVFYICDCKRCGSRTEIRATKLRGGASTTCGCGRTTPDISGERYGRLTVSHRLINKNKQAQWECICDCGKVVAVAGASLRNEVTKSCGCLRVDVSTQLGKATWRHGMEGTPTHTSWSSMKSRCLIEEHNSYQNYGGRGITVCERWLGKSGFENFVDDMGIRPAGMTLDRINVDGNYEPTNCRWASLKDQHRNTRANRTFEINGVTRTMIEISEIYGINPETLRHRLIRGWTIQEAASKPVATKHRKQLL